MAGEVKSIGPGTGLTAYYQILGSGTSIWSTSGGTGGWEAFSAADFTDYAVSMTEEGASNIYVGNFPAAVPAGAYDIVAREQAGASPAITDIPFAAGQVEWNGTKALPLSDLTTSGQLSYFLPTRIARGEMVRNFPIYLKSSTDHVTPFTSGTVSGQIARDGGSFGPLQSGAIAEVGLGFYNLQALTSGDLLANTVKLLFTGAGISGGTSDPLPLSLVLQRTSGQ